MGVSFYFFIWLGCSFDCLFCLRFVRYLFILNVILFAGVLQMYGAMFVCFRGPLLVYFNPLYMCILGFLWIVLLFSPHFCVNDLRFGENASRHLSRSCICERQRRVAGLSSNEAASYLLSAQLFPGGKRRVECSLLTKSPHIFRREVVITGDNVGWGV